MWPGLSPGWQAPARTCKKSPQVCGGKAWRTLLHRPGWWAPSSVLGLGVLSVLCALGADEIDAIGTKRYESQSGGEREIQRTMLELLNQMDGFDAMGDVKVRAQSAAVRCHPAPSPT